MTFAPRHLAVLICRHVFEHSRPVLLVRNQEDAWSLLCGGEDHGDEDFCYVGVGHLLGRARRSTPARTCRRTTRRNAAPWAAHGRVR